MQDTRENTAFFGAEGAYDKRLSDKSGRPDMAKSGKVNGNQGRNDG